MTDQACKICGNSGNNQLYQVKEMQLGLRESFTYLHCARCRCMQLLEIPTDLGKYYPNDGYYSFNRGMEADPKPSLLRKIKAAWLLYSKNPIIGRLLSIGYNPPEYYNWLKNAGVKYDDAILDVGTGNGSLLKDLLKIGFNNLTGIDPFIEKNRQYGPINIYKKSVFEITGQYDLIMLHHAFEHMDQPLEVLKQLFILLKKGKCLLIRTPVMNQYSWKKYGVNWMDLDAPRHLVIHSLESIKLLAGQAGFELRKTEFDGNYMSLIGSEQYAKDIAVPDPDSYMVNKQSSGYQEEDIQKFKSINKMNNENGDADQVAFYLFKP